MVAGHQFVALSSWFEPIALSGTSQSRTVCGVRKKTHRAMSYTKITIKLLIYWLRSLGASALSWLFDLNLQNHRVGSNASLSGNSLLQYEFSSLYSQLCMSVVENPYLDVGTSKS
ncbi:uncharacterized protein LOC132030912 [Lycium ferocissimum]|uniref:uncharacterized protein LOC132030912 n=1 Tax=Lycium ferocissimum TaxID=112874 RepID=UPI002815DFB6|nr:uncharacterized protein LOC132030912 [Lycium ferocissimum]